MPGRNGGDLVHSGSRNYGTQEVDYRPVRKKETIPYRYVSYGLCLLLIVCTVAAAIYVSFKYASVEKSPTSSGMLFSPNDSHSIPVSRTFCKSLSVWTQDGVYGYNTTLLLLNSVPKLGGNEYSDFSVNKEISANEYIYYFYYLQKDSSVVVSACYPDDEGGGTIFYLFKGNSSFNRFKDQFPNLDPKHSEKWFPVDSCSSGKSSMIKYQVPKNDFYFFLFYHRSIDGSPNYLNFTLGLNRTRYVYDEGSVTSKCTYCDMPGNINKCSVGVPLTGSYVGLLILEPNQVNNNSKWVTDKAMLSTRCYPRVWMYIVVSLAVAHAIVLVLLIAILICIGGAKYHKKRVYHPALYEHLAPNDSSSSSSDYQSENSNSPLLSLKSTRFCRSTSPK